MGSIWVEEEIASTVDSSEKIGKLQQTLALGSHAGICAFIVTLKSVFIFSRYVHCLCKSLVNRIAEGRRYSGEAGKEPVANFSVGPNAYQFLIDGRPG